MNFKNLISRSCIFSVFISAFFFCTFVSADTSFWTQSYQLEQETKYKEAIALLKKKKVTKNNAEFITLRLGWLHYLNAEYNSAISYYKAAIKINSRSLDAKISLLNPLTAQKRWREVAYLCSQILDSSPWNYQANLFLMQAHSNQGDWQSLKKQATSLIERYPTSADPLVYLARANIQLGKANAAQNAYQKLLMLFPSNLEASYYLNKK